MRAKVHQHGGDVLPGAPPLQALGGRQLVGEAVRPRLGQFFALARALLIGPHLVDQRHEKVGVKHGVEHVVDHRQRQAEAGVLLDAREAEGDHRHIAVPRLFKRLAQKGDVVRGAAAAAGLEQHQRHLLRVVFAALQGVDELTDDEDGRIAGVVVYILEARVADVPPRGGQKLHVVPVVAEDAQKQAKVHRQHVGHENGVSRGLHLRGKGLIGLLHSPHFISRAPSRLRRRIFTAPRLAISSILICV